MDTNSESAASAAAVPPGSREKILARIREALQSPAPKRHLGHHGPALTGGDSAPDADAEHWLPPVSDDLEGRINLFASISETLKTKLVRCRNLAEAQTVLGSLARENDWKTVFTHSDPLLDSVCPGLSHLDLRKTDHGYEKADLAAADAGVTGCEALVAQTGTILVSPPASGGRVLSVLVPHHVVIATAQQIVRDLREALSGLKQKYNGNLPRYFSFITGPSRTGDIERILVLGAHGPKELTVLLVDEDSPRPGTAL
jgi:L-lactate dehydrogenase complex protein LldG